MTTRRPETQKDATSEQDDEEESGRSRWAQAGVVALFGAELAGFIIAGVWLGRYVDQRFDVGPAGVLIGLFAAMAAAGLHLWKLIDHYLTDDGSDTE